MKKVRFSKVRFSNFNAIRQLGAKELNECCSMYDIENAKSLPRLAKVHMLALACELSPCRGPVNNEPRFNHDLLSVSDLKQYKTLNMYELYTMPGWNTKLTELPPITSDHTTQYLLKADVIVVDQARAYKLSRPYNMMNFVHSLKLNSGVGRFFILQGHVNPSLSTNRDDVKLCFAVVDTSTGIPFGGSCVCTAGQSGACAHIGALLFVACEILSNGLTEIPEDLSCTDKQCSWVLHKDSHVEPVLLSELVISNSSRSQQRHILTHQEDNIDDRTWKEATSVMHNNISASADQAPVGLTYLHPDRFDDTTVTDKVQQCVYQSLPILAMDFHPALAHTYEVEVQSSPPTIIEIPHAHAEDSRSQTFAIICDDFLSKLNSYYPDSVRKHIEQITMGQWSTPEWYRQKQGSIGSSKLDAVRRVVNGGKADSVIISIMGYIKPVIPVVDVNSSHRDPRKYGLFNEAKAKAQYTSWTALQHNNFKLADRGLVVDGDRPYIRVSPDGVASCDCHQDRAIEIKCPWTLRDGKKIHDAVHEKIIKYLEYDNNKKLTLVPCSQFPYYEQVQTVMAVTKTRTCDFIVWTPIEMEVMTVDFDEAYFTSELLPIIESFFKQFIATEIITQKLSKHMLPVSALYICYFCSGTLKDQENVTSEKDCSVGCSCKICQCDNWAHWKCARYTFAMSKNNVDWMCFSCSNSHAPL